MIQKQDHVAINTRIFIKIAIEMWRLRINIEPVHDKKFSIIRHSVLNVFSLFEHEGISYIDLTNRPYDPGMAVGVIDIEENPQKPKGENIIKEVIEPMILLNGQIINQGQVIIEKGMLDVPTAEGSND